MTHVLAEAGANQNAVTVKNNPMPKFKHRKTGRVIEAIFYDGSKKSFERVKSLIASDVVTKIVQFPPEDAVISNCIGYDFKCKGVTLSYFISEGEWIFVQDGHPQGLTDSLFYDRYRSVRASTPLS